MNEATHISRSPLLGGFDYLQSKKDDFEYAPHRHPELVVAAYYSGAKQAKCAGRSLEVLSGDLLLIAPETLHSAETARDGWVYSSVYLTLAQIAACTGLEEERITASIQDFQYFQSVPHLCRRLQLALQSEGDHSFALGEIFLEIFEYLANPAPYRSGSAKRSASLQAVYECIRDVPHKEWSLPGLAKIAGLSPEHLSRQFKASYGLSPFQHIVACRTRQAKTLILDGNGLTEAAHGSGFADQSHMTRWFNRIYGIPPGAFAHQIRSRQGG